ncbi:hypothetical protein ISP15_16010 [Dyella jejuensis]|uniref:Uncharacterized protein n=1 Tax=Dyella jejuensis TaxID=1432009 RepID=A0ABW8JLJ6_9GAMM
MSSHDRKDSPHPIDKAPLKPENQATRDQRKQHENENYDHALEETFPASDPVSAFVPSKTRE